jgi:hypothetical protein
MVSCDNLSSVILTFLCSNYCLFVNCVFHLSQRHSSVSSYVHFIHIADAVNNPLRFPLSATGCKTVSNYGSIHCRATFCPVCSEQATSGAQSPCYSINARDIFPGGRGRIVTLTTVLRLLPRLKILGGGLPPLSHTPPDCDPYLSRENVTCTFNFTFFYLEMFIPSNCHCFLKSEVLTTVFLKIKVLWEVITCLLGNRFRCFERSSTFIFRVRQSKTIELLASDNEDITILRNA